MDQDETWRGRKAWPRSHCVRWQPSSCSPKGHSPQFSAHICCGQTAGWIKMPLGTEVGFSPGDNVLYGDPSPSPQKGGTAAPHFSAHVLWSNGWMDQDATWYGGRPRPTPHCVRWGLALPPKTGTATHFWPMSVVAKRLD